MPDDKNSDDYVAAMAKQFAAKLGAAQGGKPIAASNATTQMASALDKAFRGRVGADDVIDLTQLPAGVDSAGPTEPQPATKSDDAAPKK